MECDPLRARLCRGDPPHADGRHRPDTVRHHGRRAGLFSGNEAAGQPGTRAYGVAEVGVSVLFWKAIALKWSTGHELGSGGSYPVPVVRSTLAASVAWTR